MMMMMMMVKQANLSHFNCSVDICFYSLSRLSKSIDCNLTYVFPLFARSPRRFAYFFLLPPSLPSVSGYLCEQ
jgi:hypothetical protein